MSGLLQLRATDAEFGQVQGPGRIVMAHQLTAQIARNSIGIDSRIAKTLNHMLGDVFTTFMHGHRPQQFIELSQGVAASAIPRLDALPGRTLQRHSPTRIHAVTRQRHARQTEHLAEVGRHRRIVLRQRKQMRITTGHRPTSAIEALMRHPHFNRIGCLPPMVLNGPDRQPARVCNRKGWRVAMHIIQRHP
ncbi:hypothetical protein D3C76_898790 [compost metagenome]